MNRKGQNFIIELFAMIMIFSIIIIIISVNALSGGKLIRFAQGAGFEAFSQDEVLLLFHETTELVSLSDNIDRITVDSEIFGCDDCDSSYKYMNYFSKFLLEDHMLLDYDDYSSEAVLKLSYVSSDRNENNLVLSRNNYLLDKNVEIGLFFPSQSRSVFFKPGGSPGGRLNSYIYLLYPLENFENLTRLYYDGQLTRDSKWRISIIPLEDYEEGSLNE